VTHLGSRISALADGRLDADARKKKTYTKK